VRRLFKGRRRRLQKAVNMKKKKDKKENKKEGPFKNRLSMFVIGGFLFSFLVITTGLAVFSYQLLYNSDYFFIRASRIDWLKSPLSEEPYSELSKTGFGQNIFKFNISSARDKALKAHPELKEMWIVREFPNRLTLKIEPRVPVAQVGEKSFFLTDQEGVVLTQEQDFIRDDLPIVTGVGWRIFRKVGQVEDSSRMKGALRLLEAFKQTFFLDNHTLTKIDVSDYRNVSFFIEDGLEVKIGHSNFEERLESLDNTLLSMEIEKDRIKYIDLRFDDVVLGTK